MTNREKAKAVLENLYGLEFESRFLDTLKGCEFIKNTQCQMYQDCETCKLFHFWYNEYTGVGTKTDIEKDALLKEFKIKLRDIIMEESKRENAEGEYVYSLTEERLFVKLIDLIWNTTI